MAPPLQDDKKGKVVKSDYKSDSQSETAKENKGTQWTAVNSDDAGVEVTVSKAEYKTQNGRGVRHTQYQIDFGNESVSTFDNYANAEKGNFPSERVSAAIRKAVDEVFKDGVMKTDEAKVLKVAAYEFNERSKGGMTEEETLKTIAEFTKIYDNAHLLLQQNQKPPEKKTR